VYLQAPADVLMQRIMSRGIPYEKNINRDYLERLGEAYARFFYNFDAAPLLIVNVATIDPIHHEVEYEELLCAINDVNRGRHFFNPAAQSIA
jgi:deoxyadenosine/deoxycytidine kinase